MHGLVEGLGEVLNDRNKVVLFHYICQLLPEEAQNEFDRIAASMLSGGDHSVFSSIYLAIFKCFHVKKQTDTTQSAKASSAAPLLGGGHTGDGRLPTPTGMSREFSKGAASGPGLLQSTPIGGGAGSPVASSAATSSVATGSGPSVVAAMKTERSKEGN